MTMGKIKLLLTADYEVFGDGSGCVDKCLQYPAKKMMQICEAFGTRITFFADVCEYWAFKETEENDLFKNGYRPATIIEKQLQDSILRGHDVQLHFHPQWLEYEFVNNCQWNLNYKYWRLPSVPGGYGSEDDPKSLLGIFTKGKKTLTDLLQPINSDYRCRAFRAGGWSIQPEKEVLNAMIACGISYDTTVAPGMQLNDGLTKYDFTNAPSAEPYWGVHDDVCILAVSPGITEIPIYTAKIPPNRLIHLAILRFIRGINSYPTDCQGQPASKSLEYVARTSKLQKLMNLFGTQTKMFDFCGGTSFEAMKFMVQKAATKYRALLETQDVPIVAIGHPKSFGNEKEFEKFLRWANNESTVKLESLEEKSFWQSSYEENNLVF